MTDAFSQKAAKRLRAPKIKRDPASGTFDSLSPLNDTAMLEQAVRWVRSITELEPLIVDLAREASDPTARQAMQITAAALSVLRASMLDALSADRDLDAVRDLTKPVLKAARLVRQGGAR